MSGRFTSLKCPRTSAIEVKLRNEFLECARDRLFIDFIDPKTPQSAGYLGKTSVAEVCRR